MSIEIPQDKIKEKKEELDKKQADLQAEVRDLQSQCAHPNDQVKYRGVVNVTVCPDCGRMDEY